MKKLYALLLVCCLAFSPLKAGCDFEFESGLATFDMTALKDLNQDILNGLPFDAKIISNFEPWVYWKPSISVHDDWRYYGLTYSFQSSGSRISVRDYSGKYRMDMRVQSNNIGGFVGAKWVNQKYFQLQARLEAGVISSKFSMSEYFELQGYGSTSDAMDAIGVDAYATPSLRFYYGIKPLAIFLNLGYQLQLDNAALFVGTRDYSLSNNNGGKLNANWSGLRLGLGLSIRL